MKFGSTGRHVSPDGSNIFKNEGQIGSVEICDTGFGTRKITPEECEERLEVTVTDIETIKNDIQKLEFELNDLKLTISKNIYKINMECLFPKKDKEEEKNNWLEERRNRRKYNARLSAILDELEGFQHYEAYKRCFKLLFEFYQLEELLK